MDAAMEVDALGHGEHGEQGNNYYQALDNDDNYAHDESADVEDNSNEQSAPYSHCVDLYIHYSPSKPLEAETPERWLMIGSCSTLNLISNKSWLSDIHKVDTTMPIHSMGGISLTCQLGYLGNCLTPMKWPCCCTT